MSIRLALVLITLTACTGTDVGNPPRGELTGFDISACKPRLEAAGNKGVKPVQNWMPDARLYSGLSCVLWELDDDTLHLRLVNHGDGCGLDSQWKPRLLTRDAGLDLQLARTDCSEAGCFGCLYDLAFDVRVPSALRGLDELELRVLGDTCHTDQPAVHNTLRVPTATRQGATCSYTYQDGVTAWFHASPGDPRVPCGSFDDRESRDCVSGVCTEVEPSRHLCLPACSSDADCLPSDVTACSAGVCQLRSAP